MSEEYSPKCKVCGCDISFKESPCEACDELNREVEKSV